MKPKKPSTKKLAELIEEQFGNLHVVARKCEVTRKTVQAWIEKDKSGKLELAVESGREKLVDFAEMKALDLMSKGSVSIVTLILKTLGKKRGYVEQKRYDPNVVIGELDLTQTQTGRIDLRVKHVIINSREDLDRVYKGDTKQIADKTVDSVVDAIDAEFIEGG